MTTTKEAKSRVTEYVILQERKLTEPQLAGLPGEGEVTLWDPVARVTAASKDAALKAIEGENVGTFRAVPLSSWKGTITRQQTTLFTTTKGDD